MRRPKMLDLFCGAGGCSVGYHRAGFDVIGVDVRPQKNYPFEFFESDAMAFPLGGFDAIHASPPCQAYSVTKSIGKGRKNRREHPDLVESVRSRLVSTGLPFVIENVPGAPLENPLLLCGTMFDGLRVYRHRLFELHGFSAAAPRKCKHTHRMGKSKGEYHTLEKSPFITCVGHNFQAKSGRIAMQIDWMTRDEMAQAIPPAYTEYIGRQLIKSLASDSQKR